MIPQEQPRWMRTLQVGDVITNGGPWRIVREVKHDHDGRLRAVSLVIRRCSWTHRCYTVLGANDLRQMGYRKVPSRPGRLRSKMDRLIDRAVHQGAADRKDFVLTCCDVKGFP